MDLGKFQNITRIYKGIYIPKLAKITTMFPDWWRSLNKKKG